MPFPFRFRVLFSAIRSYSTTPHSAPFLQRTHHCGALSAKDAGSRVILAGWLLPERKGRIVSFFPLKDSFGSTQLIVDVSEGVHPLSEVPVESTVLIEGTVQLRPETARRHGPTGDIDVHVERFVVLNPADSELPFVPSNTYNVANEEIRSRYRYLDLRRSVLSANLKKRSEVGHLVRNFLHEAEFVEVETPILLRSSPEGAREFLVPSRTSGASDDGSPLFYALTQSPQQPKQLLISSGAVDRYFQIAKCFRDEDGRKDRQPEFTQLDLEMAFVSWGNSDGPWRIGGREVRHVVESLIRKIWQDHQNVCLPEMFTVMTYHEAMSRFGSDKPDTRFGLEILDITHLLPPATRNVLQNLDQILECIVLRRSRDAAFITASQNCEGSLSIERIAISKENEALWLSQSGTLRQVISEQITQAPPELALQSGDHLWLSRRSRAPKGGSTALGRLRLRLSESAQALGHFSLPQEPHFLWITEFPLFTRSDADKEFLAQGRWSSSHHPFTAPMWQDIDDLYSGRIESVRGQHYDLVLNGVEIGGGSVRVHDAAMQEYIFSKVLQLTEREMAPFDQLLHALKCGAPPHGGIALGFDRLMAILCNTPSIRDVIAFPKTSVGTDLLFKSPAPVDEKVLGQYGLRFR